jgi:hypothetical protein
VVNSDKKRLILLLDFFALQDLLGAEMQATFDAKKALAKAELRNEKLARLLGVQEIKNKTLQDSLKRFYFLMHLYPVAQILLSRKGDIHPLCIKLMHISIFIAKLSSRVLQTSKNGLQRSTRAIEKTCSTCALRILFLHKYMQLHAC